jgi:hypothetical protein
MTAPSSPAPPELLHPSFIWHNLAPLFSDSHGLGGGADFVSLFISAMPGWAWR